MYNVEAAYGWASIPGELLKLLVHEEPLSWQIQLSSVCKQWQETIADDAFGKGDLAALGLQAPQPNSWIRCYRDFVEDPQIIALDVSGSMEIVRKGDALRVLEQLTQKLAIPILARGIECVVFASSCYTEKLYTPEAVYNTFKKSFKKTPWGNWSFLGGTSLNALFNTLIALEGAHRAIKSDVRCHVTIISDFEDTSFDIKTLTKTKSQMSIQCINVGSWQDKCVMAFAIKLQHWQKKLEEQEQLAQTRLSQERLEYKCTQLLQAALKERLVKTQAQQPIILKGSQSAKKRNRHQLLARERTARKRKFTPLTASEESSKLQMALLENWTEWQPQAKRGKITGFRAQL
jgi:hypothetical protein